MSAAAVTRSKKKKQGLRPKKRLGQHFLQDRGIIETMLDMADFDETDVVMEIGAGLGALTLPLSQRVRRVIAIEKDETLLQRLENRLVRAGARNVTLVNDDILKLDFNRFIPLKGKKAVIIGNLPYNISSPFLEKLFQHRRLIMRAVLMFQAELARRLTAAPGSKAYGALTIITRYHAHPTALLDVPKDVFYPKPKIDSMVLELDFTRPYPKRASDETGFVRIVKGAFAHRRKTISNSLKQALVSYNEQEILINLEKCAIAPDSRAETLSIDHFLCLASALLATRPLH